MNIGVVYIFSNFWEFIYPGVEWLGHVLILFFIYWKTYILFCTVAVTIYIATNSVQGFFSPCLCQSTFVICVLFDDSILTNEKWYLTVVLIFIFLMISNVEPLLMCLFVICLWRNVYSALLLIFWLGCLAFDIELYEMFT